MEILKLTFFLSEQKRLYIFCQLQTTAFYILKLLQDKSASRDYEKCKSRGGSILVRKGKITARKYFFLVHALARLWR